MASVTRRVAAATLVVLGAVLVSGCAPAGPAPSSNGSPSAAPPRRTPTRLPSDLPSFTSPLVAYELSGSNLYTMEEAQFQLAGDCMVRFGFPRSTPALNRDEMIAEQQESDAHLYGVDDLTEARANGYLPEVVPGSSQASAMPSGSRTYEFVYTGNKDGSVVPPPGGWTSPGTLGGLTIPPGGCLGDARSRLWASPDAQVKDELAQGLRIAAYEHAKADPRVQRLFVRWSTCMAKQGYQYQTPVDPSFDRSPGSAASSTEIRTAVADIGCKDKIDLVPQWHQVDVDYQHDAIEKNQLALTEESNKIRAALKKATAVLHGKG